MSLSQKTKREFRKNAVGYLYIAPVLLGILIFTLIPILYALLCSFFKMPLTAFRLSELGEFVGLGNYAKIFTVESYAKDFWQSMKVTFVYAGIYIPLSLVLSFGLALLLNQKLKGMRLFRTLFYLPVLLPAVCSGILWGRITDPYFGVINNMLESIGLPAWGWFTKAETSMSSFIFISLFGLGGNMILWLAQLKSVPVQLYESSMLDGAGKFRQLWQITVPLCTPMILYNLIMSIIGVMQTYAQVVTLTGGGGEKQSLYFYVMNIYDNRLSEFGYTCALSFVLFLIIALLTLLSMRTSKWVYYGEEG